MTDGTAAFRPAYGVPPGETLVEVLAERGMSQAELARRTGLSAKHINQIIQGAAPISPETALKLERVTTVPARLWVNLEANYQVYISSKDEAATLATSAGWLRRLPISELINRGWLKEGAAPQIDRLREALAFFGVASPDAWRTMWDVPTAYRKSHAFESDMEALSAWLRIGELKVADFEGPPFDRVRFRSLLQEIRLLTRSSARDEWEPALKAACRSAGVAVVIEPELKRSRVHGASRWLHPDRPLIQLSLRYRWADIFWFTFFHEAGHLLLHDRRKLTFLNVGPGDDEFEREADDFAARTLIPREYASELRFLKTSADIENFAERLRIGPGIVVGRMQHEAITQHRNFNDLRRRLTASGGGG